MNGISPPAARAGGHAVRVLAGHRAVLWCPGCIPGSTCTGAAGCCLRSPRIWSAWPSTSSAFAKATAGQVRNPFAVEKMQVSAPNQANPDGSIIYRSGLNPKIQRNFEVFSPCDFIAAITQHIPDKSFQLVRYYPVTTLSRGTGLTWRHRAGLLVLRSFGVGGCPTQTAERTRQGPSVLIPCLWPCQRLHLAGQGSPTHGPEGALPFCLTPPPRLS